MHHLHNDNMWAQIHVSELQSYMDIIKVYLHRLVSITLVYEEFYKPTYIITIIRC